MPETNPPIRVTGRTLADLATAIGERGLPPVDRWNPDHCGDSGDADRRATAPGITGQPHSPPGDGPPVLDRLRREPDGSHVLVTPVEKLTIEVEVTAFRAIAMTSEGEGQDRRIAFDLDSGDAVIARPRSSAHRHRRRPRPEPANRSSATGSRR